jgi:hypothetical protein
MTSLGGQFEQQPFVPASGLFRTARAFDERPSSHQLMLNREMSRAFSETAQGSFQVADVTAATHRRGSIFCTPLAVGPEIGPLGSAINGDSNLDRPPRSSTLLGTAATKEGNAALSFEPLAAELSSHTPGHGSADVSAKAECFARRQGVWGTLIFLKSRIASEVGPVDTVKVDLVVDPEVDGSSTLSFTIRTRAALEAVLDLDGRLRDLIGESIAARHLVYFAVRFDFDE